MMKSKEMVKIGDFSIPRIGFGTYGLGKNATDSIFKALETGYRHIDTADIYGTHKNVAEAIKKSDLDRKDIFITTKVWRDDLTKEGVINAVQRFLEELQTDYIDLLLIHRPSTVIPVDVTLNQMSAEKTKGNIRFMGVSNFDKAMLEDVLEMGYKVVNNQVEFHPSHKEDDLLEFCRDNNVSFTAYSPLGEGEDLDKLKVQRLSQKHGIPESHIILQWLLEKGAIVIPRSSDPTHIKENYEAFQNWLKGTVIKMDDL